MVDGALALIPAHQPTAVRTAAMPPSMGVPNSTIVATDQAAAIRCPIAVAAGPRKAEQAIVLTDQAAAGHPIAVAARMGGKDDPRYVIQPN